MGKKAQLKLSICISNSDNHTFCIVGYISINQCTFTLYVKTEGKRMFILNVNKSYTDDITESTAFIKAV